VRDTGLLREPHAVVDILAGDLRPGLLVFGVRIEYWALRCATGERKPDDRRGHPPCDRSGLKHQHGSISSVSIMINAAVPERMTRKKLLPWRACVSPGAGDERPGDDW
jgi:hypothetical protein